MLRAYLEFLCSLQLNPQLARTKTFEEDLRGDLNPTKLLDELFFRQEQWLNFDAFFDLYWHKYKRLLKDKFPCLKEAELLCGLQARLYRTQCGILTEYQAYLASQAIFGVANVCRSLAMDRAGVDFTITHQEQQYHMHIFVDTQRAWQYRQYKSVYKQVEKVCGIHVDLPYALKEGKVNSLHYLPNGFGIYSPRYLRYLQQEIYSGSLLEYSIKGVNEEGFIYHRIY